LQDLLRSERASEVISELVEMLYRFNVAQPPDAANDQVEEDSLDDETAPIAV
jgi:hypothetical protein